jgi:hypothetical protein
MSKANNKFSVKSDMYCSLGCDRTRSVDGPWAPSIEAAIAGYKAMLERKGLVTKTVYHAFIAERCPEAESSSKDSKGNVYKVAEIPGGLNALLEAAGLNVPGM